MRHLKKNQRIVAYANVLDTASATNDKGQLTGEKIVNYSEPQKIWVYYDENIAYDKDVRGTVNAETVRLIMSPFIRDINDGTVFWIDAPTTGPHDFIVSSISRTISEMTVNLRRVAVRTRYGDY